MVNLNRFTNGVAACIILVTGIFFTSCNNDSSVSPQQDVAPSGDNIQFSYIGSPNTRDIPVSFSLDTVKMPIKDIKLHGANGLSNSKVGPFVLMVRLDNVAGVTYIGSNLIPLGTYDKMIFQIHKPNPNENVPDPEFTDGGRYSVIAKGYYNNVRFVYKSTKTCHQMLAFPNALVVTETSSNVTLKIQPHYWFFDLSTYQYLDPNNPSNGHIIDNNIKENVNHNFRAFKDNDRNGIPDN